MRTGKCPKCGSGTVYSKDDGMKFSVMQGVVLIKTGPITAPSSTTSYICSTCGYFENYITDKSKLSEVSKNWKKI